MEQCTVFRKFPNEDIPNFYKKCRKKFVFEVRKQEEIIS